MDEQERQRWHDDLLSRVRTVVERVASGSASSEYVIDVQRLRGRRVRLRLVTDVVDDDEEVIVSEPYGPPIDTDGRGPPTRKARRTRRL